jgi:hypothetical protein
MAWHALHNDVLCTWLVWQVALSESVHVRAPLPDLPNSHCCVGVDHVDVNGRDIGLLDQLASQYGQ